MAYIQKQILFIVGPTAVGKSDVALLLAKKLNGEIVSCDSMQVYKEINIASNKPNPDELKDIPHHLINIVSIAEPFDVVLYSHAAVKVIDDILSRGKLPIVVGGSGMYMNVLLDGIFEGVASNEELRDQLLQELEVKGKDAMYEELRKEDPEAATKIHPNNTKRLIRAIEVLRSQEKSFTQLKQERQGLWGEYDIHLFCLHQEREELYDRINRRVDQMVDDGLVDEVKEILTLIPSKTADVLIGIKEIRGLLEGEYDLEQAKYLMKRNTRHFAKRQLTWFRKDDRLKWILRKEEDKPEDLVNGILKEIND